MPKSWPRPRAAMPAIDTNILARATGRRTFDQEFINIAKPNPNDPVGRMQSATLRSQRGRLPPRHERKAHATHQPHHEGGSHPPYAPTRALRTISHPAIFQLPSGCFSIEYSAVYASPSGPISSTFCVGTPSTSVNSPNCMSRGRYTG